MKNHTIAISNNQELPSIAERNVRGLATAVGLSGNPV